jgi:hypothetical protein
MTCGFTRSLEWRAAAILPLIIALEALCTPFLPIALRV